MDQSTDVTDDEVSRMSFAPLRRVRPLVLGAAVAAAASVTLVVPHRADGHDFVRDSAPVRWVEQAMTEDLPPLKFPAYFDDFDRAKAQVHAGRYKTALLTLRKITDPKPEQLVTIALCKGRALFVTGRTDEALRTLSEATKVPADKEAGGAAGVDGKGEVELKAHPRVQLLRAEIWPRPAGRPTRWPSWPPTSRPTPTRGAGTTGPARCPSGSATPTRRRALRLVRRGPERLLGQVAGQGEAAGVRRRRAGDVDGPGGRPVGHAEREVPEQLRLPRQILNVFVRAQEIDVAYWPAKVAAAEYFMERDDRRRRWRS
jgi:hypothetical protein